VAFTQTAPSPRIKKQCNIVLWHSSRTPVAVREGRTASRTETHARSFRENVQTGHVRRKLGAYAKKRLGTLIVGLYALSTCRSRLLTVRISICSKHGGLDVNHITREEAEELASKVSLLEEQVRLRRLPLLGSFALVAQSLPAPCCSWL
jgi:hypothetical protein